MVAEGNKKAEDKAEATRKARAARESRLTSHAFPGAKPKTEDEQVCETVVDELEKLPLKSLAQSMWAPKCPHNVQQPTASQGQCRPPSTPAANETATTPNPKIDHPIPPSRSQNAAPGSQAPPGVSGQPNKLPAPFGDRPFHGRQSTGPRNQGPPGGWDPPKKPAAMRNKKKNKNGPPQLPPHLRGNGPGAPPTGGSRPP